MKSIVTGGTLIALIILMALIGWIHPPYGPTEMNIAEKFQPPSLSHWLGTDQYGRDILSRLIVASHYALMVSIGAVGLGVLVGASLGAIAGYTRNGISRIIMLVMDGLFAFPNLLLALMIVSTLGVGETNALLAIAIFNVPLFARLMYSFILEAHAYGYVKAAYTYGAGPARVLFIHMIPAALPRLGVQVTTSMGGAILAESALSFLGLGVQPPFPSWGGMLDEAQHYLSVAPWYPVFPGVMILIAVMGFNLLGDGLRDLQR